MVPRKYLVVAALIGATMTLAGCTPTAATNANAAGASNGDVKAGQVLPNNTGSNRVVLTVGTAERLGIQTSPVQEMITIVAGDSTATAHKTVPLAAVFYDKNGATWVYVSPDPLSYVRTAVSVARIDGDVAVLQSGPPTGTAVVTTGTPELVGIEDGVAGE